MTQSSLQSSSPVDVADGAALLLSLCMDMLRVATTTTQAALDSSPALRMRATPAPIQPAFPSRLWCDCADVALAACAALAASAAPAPRALAAAVGAELPLLASLSTLEHLELYLATANVDAAARLDAVVPPVLPRFTSAAAFFARFSRPTPPPRGACLVSDTAAAALAACEAGATARQLRQHGMAVFPGALPPALAAQWRAAAVGELARLLTRVHAHAGPAGAALRSRALDPRGGFSEVVYRSRGRFDVRSVAVVRPAIERLMAAADRAEATRKGKGSSTQSTASGDDAKSEVKKSGANSEDCGTEFDGVPAWLWAVREVLGADARLHFAGCVVALPGAEPQQWHRDGGSLYSVAELARAAAVPEAALVPDASAAFAFQVFIPLVDLDVGNGPTQFMPDTHLAPEFAKLDRFYDEARALAAAPADPRARVAAGPVVVAPLGRAGDAVIMDYRTMHAGAAYPRSVQHGDAEWSSTPAEQIKQALDRLPRARPLLSLTFAKPWWRDSHNYENPSINEFIAEAENAKQNTAANANTASSTMTT